MNARGAIALVIALTFLTLAFSGCLGSNDSGDGSEGSSDASAGDTSTPDPTAPPCPKPWPARIDMIQIPESMIVGQTYIFKCQLFVQNYDDNCTLSPWWDAVDTPFEWSFTNNGTTLTNESITNNPYGIASVNFICPSEGNWTVVARWAGNANHI